MEVGAGGGKAHSHGMLNTCKFDNIAKLKVRMALLKIPKSNYHCQN